MKNCSEFRPMCIVEYKNPYYLTTRLKQRFQGPVKNEFQCMQCQEKFDEKITYKNHMTIQHQFVMY